MDLEIELIKAGLKSLLRSLWDFVKKIYVFCFFYGRLCVIPVIFAVALMQLLKVFGVPLDICMTVMKLCLIIGQVVPAASYAGVINEDPNVEGSMDICFSGWIIISILVWFEL